MNHSLMKFIRSDSTFTLIDTKKLNWRDLTGPEKVKLFSNINIPQLLPSLEKRTELQKLWANFYDFVKYLSKTECDSAYTDKEAIFSPQFIKQKM